MALVMFGIGALAMVGLLTWLIPKLPPMTEADWERWNHEDDWSF